MAEDKKSKIDLKSRLGRRTVSSAPGGPSIPPPVGGGRSSIPVPPFGTRPSAPPVDPSNPYSAMGGGQAPAPKPQAIKVEMSEEVVQAQKKARGRFVVLAVVGALVGVGIGFAFGSGHAKNQSAGVAVAGAKALVGEVDDATVKAEKLNEVLQQAQSKLSKGKFPAEEVSALGGIRIPFEGLNLTNKGIGRFKPQLVNQLIGFASDASAVNEQTEKVNRVLTGNRKAIEDVLAQQDKPKVNWGVVIQRGPHGPWASMYRVPKPFLAKNADDKEYAWPKEFELTEGKQKVKLELFEKGDPTGEMQLLPVDPTTESGVCPSDLLFKIARELRDLQQLLSGAPPMPGEDPTGLITNGSKIVEQLKGIGGPS